MFTPIPKAKDTKQDYENTRSPPARTCSQSYDAGTSLNLKKNPNWDPNTDPVRHQYAGRLGLQVSQDTIKAQRQVLTSSGPDANALNYERHRHQPLSPGQGHRPSWSGQAPRRAPSRCTMDTRKIPLEVRKPSPRRSRTTVIARPPV